MFDCSGYTCAELAEKLANARASYEQLIMGGAVRVVVDQNGERVEFTAATAPRLSLYIQTILSEMRRMGCACAVPGPQQQRALKFIF